MLQVVLQSLDTPDPGGIDVAFSLGGGAASAFLSTLLVGAILVALAPDYTERQIDEIRENVVGAFIYGVISLIALLLLSLVLFITIVGVPVAVALLVLAVVLWAVGAAIAFLAIADSLVGHDDGWAVPLVLAAGINGGLALTGIGGLVSFFVGAVGFGTVLRDLL
ncbi:putative membrane protein related to bactofilin [Halapricum desulfuricans]|uniref:Putative membrane protein related to bactofilin n=1 Tax=Halapricum desulfuricans TaxID=2841257 RepID=A0A897NSD2_9EURY|nr:hypothetical protein [Halapricum desulfuricans]QSG13096.1 putative membrane protein related to bactofilin [Halapricum desulfuricans]